MRFSFFAFSWYAFGQILAGDRCMGILEEVLEVPGYEKVVKVEDSSSGLQAIIAIHNTTLGPALGGTRIYPYQKFDEALTDVLRLSKGMTYKSAIAQTGLGGGKSVIIADSKTQKTPKLLQSFGRAVDRLKGQYVCAEDIGCGLEDCMVIRQTTPYVCGLKHEMGSGNPAPYTAWGVFRGIQATANRLFGTDSLEGKTVAIQGVGSVGTYLMEYLFWAGAHLIVTDIDLEKAKQVARQYRAKIVGPHEILEISCDILAPCAMGGIINEKTIPKLQCRAVVGASNNQLLKESDARLLAARGILYAPDFVVNAGGLVNVLCELSPKGYDAVRSRDKVNQIYRQLLTIYEIADQNNFSTHEAAVALADYRLKYGIGKREQDLYFYE
ncbi:MAG: Glu/Leu/Phe/Val dehydrogenase [Simkania sp.]|nr:Glu/Leu/Phe/Val dehydrogenase [Simkania sp.]MCP5489788.1 Glu/Leu/Phe/Val dehydrogenase [Chlamydiales bacterium]